MNEELAAALNRWRMSQFPVPTPNEAIYKLLTLALDKEGVALNHDAAATLTRTIRSAVLSLP